MRAISLLLIASCSSGGQERRLEPCTGDGVTAHIEAVEWHEVAHQAYRLGRYLGMPQPVEEARLRICNGTDQPIHLHPPEILNADDAQHRCQVPSDFELQPHQAVKMTVAGFNHDGPVISVEVAWRDCSFYSGDAACHELIVHGGLRLRELVGSL